MSPTRRTFAWKVYRHAWPAILALNGLVAGALLLVLIFGWGGLFIFLGTWPLIALLTLAVVLMLRPFLKENRDGKA